MKLQRQETEDPKLDITPLIDVVFLLLIFFMVTTTFQKEAQLRIEIPRADQQPTATQPETLEIIIDSQGRYFMGQQEVVNTRPAEGGHPQGDGRQQRTARSGRMRARQSVVTAMDVLGQLGFAQLSIATTRPEEDG